MSGARPPPTKKARLTPEEYKKQMAALQALRTSSFKKPSWAALPPANVKMSLEVVRNGAILTNIDLCKRSYFLLGKIPKAADIVMEHDSISRIHAALVHHSNGSTKIIDLKSRYGTTLNGKKLEPQKEYDLNRGDALRFGASSRTYILRVLQQGERAAVLPAKPKEAGQFSSLVQTVVVKKSKRKKKKKAGNALIASIRPAPAAASGANPVQRNQPILTSMPTKVQVLKKYTFVSGQKPTEIEVGELPEDIRKQLAKNGTDQKIVEAKVEIDDDEENLKTVDDTATTGSAAVPTSSGQGETAAPASATTPAP